VSAELLTAFPAIEVVYGMRRILRVNVKQNRRGDLKVERIFRNRHIQHIFEIPWNTLSAAERTTLDSFFQSVRGRSLGDIDFTDPWDDTHYTCRLDSDEINLEEDLPSHWSSTIRLIQVLGFNPIYKPPVTAFPIFASGAVVQLPYRMNRFYRTVVQIQEDDTEKRFEDFAIASGIQRWAVGGEALETTDATNLLNAWEGNAGPYRSMSFTEPETNTVYASVHFVETEVTHELISTCASSLRLTLEELK
jgi:hypothetical protein